MKPETFAKNIQEWNRQVDEERKRVYDRAIEDGYGAKVATRATNDAEVQLRIRLAAIAEGDETR